MAILRTSSNQNNTIIPHKIDTGSDGSKMPIHIVKILFPRATKEQLESTKSKNFVLKNKNKKQNNIYTIKHMQSKN